MGPYHASIEKNMVRKRCIRKIYPQTRVSYISILEHDAFKFLLPFWKTMQHWPKTLQWAFTTEEDGAVAVELLSSWLLSKESGFEPRPRYFDFWEWVDLMFPSRDATWLKDCESDVKSSKQPNPTDEEEDFRREEKSKVSAKRVLISALW